MPAMNIDQTLVLTKKIGCRTTGSALLIENIEIEDRECDKVLMFSNKGKTHIIRVAIDDMVLSAIVMFLCDYLISSTKGYFIRSLQAMITNKKDK